MLFSLSLVHTFSPASRQKSPSFKDNHLSENLWLSAKVRFKIYGLKKGVPWTRTFETIYCLKHTHNTLIQKKKKRVHFKSSIYQIPVAFGFPWGFLINMKLCFVLRFDIICVSGVQQPSQKKQEDETMNLFSLQLKYQIDYMAMCSNRELFVFLPQLNWKCMRVLMCLPFEWVYNGNSSHGFHLLFNNKCITTRME